MVGDSPVSEEDVLAVEEPLEVRVGVRLRTVTMRTPGNDYDPAAGFFVPEGGITRGEHRCAAHPVGFCRAE